MKKLRKILSLIVAISFLFPVGLKADTFKKATLIHENIGNKIVVTNELEAKRAFSLGYHLYDSKMLGYSIITNYQTVLSASISSSQTTIPVSSLKTKDGHTLVKSDFGEYIYLSLETGAVKEEIIRCTDISGSSFTGCTRGLAFYGTSTSAVVGNQYAHSAGSKVTMSNVHYVYQEFIDRANPTANSDYVPTTAFNLTTKTWVENRNGYWESSVDTFANLPAGSQDGEARVTLDDSKLYVWASSTQQWILAGSGGGAGTIYLTIKMGSEAEGDDNKTFALDTGSWPDKRYLNVFVNGILMEENEDYYASSTGNTIIFDEAVADDDKVTLKVDSISYYNPAWGSVDSDLVPTADNTYNIGSSSLKFKDGYFSTTTVDNYSGNGVIDPDNPVAQSPAQLIGGDDIVLQNFIDLADGANNGKFTANIDGVEYKDLALDLVNGFTPSAIEQLNSNGEFSTSNAGQSFKNVSLRVIKSILIKMKTYDSGSTCILSLYEGEGIAGTPIATASANVGADVTFTFSNAVILKENQQYTFNINRASGVFSPRLYDADGYSDGNAYLSLAKQPANIDLYFRIINDTFTLANDGINFVLFLLNEKIKTETGRAHTVIYNTDHFEITNAVAGFHKSILKLTAPTTGTDISGAGYLDLGANATEVAGDGDDYKLVRLDENGIMPISKISLPIIPTTQAKSLDTVYQNTSLKSKIVYVTFSITAGSMVNEDAKASVIIGATITPNITILSTKTGPENNFTNQDDIRCFTFIVPPAYYYKVLKELSTHAFVTLISWFEAEI